jgi:hypothetical protein
MKNIFLLIILYSTICLARTDMEIAKDMKDITTRILQLDKEITVESASVKNLVDNLALKVPSDEEINKHVIKFNTLMNERLELTKKANALIKEHDDKPGSKKLGVDSKKDVEDSI